MTEQELIQRTRKLTQGWDGIRIVGAGWAGDTRRGFQFNPLQAMTSDGGEPIPPSITGACCPEDGDCFITSQEICEGGGGTYQGDGTDCDPDPCPPKGACCVDTGCTIETEDHCTGMGGTYQGDDTTCDPNPCSDFGSCCPTSTISGCTSSCFQTTSAGCVDGLGNPCDFHPGVFCDSNPCTEPGICCDCGDPFCAGCCFRFEGECSGTWYAGDDCHGCSGPCCIDGECSIETVDACADAMGTFVGFCLDCEDVICG